ncbi:pyridoxal phosphate-dependent transferase [Clohesyomyces aquaticus]|uniref:Pyridoxal phosphate-dependent transferase n=1 Tax=Clohesyomyces aquaticus TaxID=1231657 RepID=A0A1Y1Y7I6_9PLEO|nr:pyridoxal phosphate-dependent transferase [Clohesyomyces aquaticus]
MPPSTAYSPSTLAIHADDHTNTLTDVAPAIHVSTTFRYPRTTSHLVPVPAHGAEEVDLSTPLVYARLANSNINRLETILAPLVFPGVGEEEIEQEGLANHVVSYSSGLSAFHAVLVNLVPRVVAIGEGYHGCHGVLGLHTKMSGLKTVSLFADDAAWDDVGLGKGDVVHIETPLNPTGEAFHIAAFAERAHKRGAYLTVDATFGPPGLQDPLALGADVVMHSGTKYIGGHSDLLCGILATRRGTRGREMARVLRLERLFLGSVMGNLEGWLGVRSLRTLELRVQRQSKSAEKLVAWLDGLLGTKDTDTSEEAEIVRKTVKKITHASLQAKDPTTASWLTKQMPNGYGPVFAISTHTPRQAKTLPEHLKLFHHATSLGGVESLIEWRRMSDSGVDERLLRVSVGVEDWEDLKKDLLRGLRAVVGLREEGKGMEGKEEGEEKELVHREIDVQTGGEGAKGVGGADGAV